MPGALGTRTRQNFEKERIDQGEETRSFTRDVGMTKNVTVSLTFTSGPPGQITGANGTFANTFAVGDPIVVRSANINNGHFIVTALDGVNNAFLQVDPPPQPEGPLVVNVRTE